MDVDKTLAVAAWIFNVVQVISVVHRYICCV